MIHHTYYTWRYEKKVTNSLITWKPWWWFILEKWNPGNLLGGIRLSSGVVKYDFNANIQQAVSNTSPDLDSLFADGLPFSMISYKLLIIESTYQDEEQ